MITLKTDEVSIRCMGCSKLSTLEEAIREEWKMCKFCNFTICSFCLMNLGQEKQCLSYVCLSKKRAIDPVGLPVEKIIIFAQENYQSDYRQGLLYQLFYKDQEKLYAPPFFVVQEKKDTIEEEEKPTKLQEEVWKNFQVVITKRKGGKFVTWERVV
ncbi:MAG: hypothetical protein HUU50_08800 [Candidatus Brocadiae bacterium]|nr:hypothetical protein [Candidatus Brocadiia bacterium]